MSMGTGVLCMAYPLIMPYLFVNVDKVCFDTFQSDCRDVIWSLTPDCDTDIEFGNINIMCDIPSNYE